MYNPFPLLNEKILKEKIAAGKRYFVRQTFPRGHSGDPGIKAAFLLRAYDADEKDQAEEHIKHLKNDGNARLYDSESPADLEKLNIAARQPAGLQVYYAGTIKTGWQPPASYQDKIKNYIRTWHPGWKPKSSAEKIQAGLHERFGMLFLKLSFKDEEEVIPFELIEKS